MLFISACDVTKPDRNDKNNSKIVMTLQSETVILGLQGNGEINVRIGSEVNKKIDATNFTNFPFNFLDSETRIIEITGEVTHLLFSDNFLTEIDISKSPMLQYIDCSDNHLTKLDLNKNVHLKEIDISNNQFSADELDILFHSLPKTQTKRTIIFSNNPGSEDCDPSIAEAKGWNVESEEKMPNIALEPSDPFNPNFKFVLRGEGKVVIVWGDLETEKRYINVNTDHYFSRELLAWSDVVDQDFLVKIYGDITYLHCIDWLHGLDVGNSPILEYLNTRVYGYELNLKNNTKLRFLDCSNSRIATSLDLSNNIFLEKLYAVNNQLIKINLTNNPLIEKLQISGNLLSNIDLSNNKLLTILDISGNRLTSIDLYNNLLLRELFLRGNQLTNVDVSKLIKLNILDCSFNQLINLDVTNNKLLTYLSCEKNLLKELILTNNSLLNYLSCFDNQLIKLDTTNNTLLNELYCYNNQLVELDVTKNNLLRILYCYNNQIRELDVSNNYSLVRLQCYENNLKELNVSNNKSLMELYFSYNQVQSIDFSSNYALRSVMCSFNEFSTIDLNILFQTLNDEYSYPLRSKNIYYGGNPGSEDSDTNIATEKRWNVHNK